MAYTPELSMQSSCALRRIAWALDMPMTKAIAKVFEHLPEILDNEKVCHLNSAIVEDAGDTRHQV